MLSIAKRQQNTGFTLIEVMLVVALIGVIVTLVQLNFVGSSVEDKLKKESLRFAGIYELAAEYAMLNNVELGIVFEEQQYQIVGFDGIRWTPLADNQLSSPRKLSAGVIYELQLDDLPLEEKPMFDADTFVVENDDFREEQDKLIVPQLYILSGGDITPFSVEFSMESDFEIQNIAYKVTGLYSTPLSVEGPIQYD